MEGVRLLLDGRWNARDFGLALEEIENYCSFLESGKVTTSSSFRDVEWERTSTQIIMHQVIYPESSLQILRISYNSPGVCDLTGAGKIVETLFNFLKFIIEHKSNRHLRELELEERRIMLQERRLQAALFAKQNGLAPESEFIEKSGVNNLLRLIDDRQIVGVEKLSVSE